VTCPHCDRKDFFSVSRKRNLIEFRMIKTERQESGEFKYDANWKKERDIIDGKLFLRCNACQREIKKEDCEKMGLEEIKITKSGVVAVLKHGFF
jgi:hypothetical protein